MDSRNDSGTELDDEDIKYGDVEGVCLDSESAIFLACDLTPSWGASVVDVNKVAESIAALESINVDGMEVKTIFLSLEYLTYRYKNSEGQLTPGYHSFGSFGLA